MKKLVYNFSTLAQATQVIDLMTADYMSEFIYVSNIGGKVTFITDFPKRTRRAVKDVISSIGIA